MSARFRNNIINRGKNSIIIGIQLNNMFLEVRMVRAFVEGMLGEVGRQILYFYEANALVINAVVLTYGVSENIAKEPPNNRSLRVKRLELKLL